MTTSANSLLATTVAASPLPATKVAASTLPAATPTVAPYERAPATPRTGKV
ncbi:MAG: hypothetical protein QE493_01880 [Verrucomicrobiae bacterium]|nr:hypothetical protein [Verrucomicrobiae bacterium]